MSDTDHLAGRQRLWRIVSDGMIVGMTSRTKIAVSLPSNLVEAAREAVEAGRAKSVSAYVATALEEKAGLDELAEMLDEMLAHTGGPLTPDEMHSLDKAAGWH